MGRPIAINAYPIVLEKSCALHIRVVTRGKKITFRPAALSFNLDFGAELLMPTSRGHRIAISRVPPKAFGVYSTITGCFSFLRSGLK